MKICIFGAGAIGGYMGAKLAQAGADVSLVARGPHLAAMRAGGLRLIKGGQETRVDVTASDDPATLGPQDYVIVTLKAHSVPGVVDAMQPLLGPDTAVVTAMNGVPWWFFHRFDGPHRDHRLASIDPDGRQWHGIGPHRAIGCAVYVACEVAAPGVVRHLFGNRFILGEPDGAVTPRLTRLAEALAAAGFEAPVTPHIRDSLWLKLWGNLAFNPISALTHGTLADIASDPGTAAVARAMMVEAQAVGERLGIRFNMDVDRRIAQAAAVGPHRTSMLQDLDRGRSLEIDALVGVVQELGRLTGVATPAIDMILALVRQRARKAGCDQPGA